MSKNIKTCDVTSNKISEPFLINEPIVIILSPHGELEINKLYQLASLNKGLILNCINSNHKIDGLAL